MSMNNIQGGSFNNVGGSFSHIGTGSFGPTQQQKPQQDINLEGSALKNLNENILSISSGITTLIGGILGYDKEGREALGQIVGAAQGNQENQKNLANALLSTYNVTLDDIGNMPLGELTGNVIEGIWKHPVDAYFDFMSLKGLLVPKVNKARIKPEDIKLGEKIDKNGFLVQTAEETTKNNVRLSNVGNEFVKQIENIESKYNPKTISLGMQAIETVGFKNAPKDLLPVMGDLIRANDTYKQFTRMAGADILDDLDMAAIELLSKEHHVPFEQMQKLGKDTKIYQEALNYVRENDVRPLFHLKPKIYDMGDTLEKVETGLLKRAYGTIDYADASNKLASKASDFVNKVVSSEVLDAPNKINQKIREVNKISKANIPELNTGSVINNRMLKELNTELKKTMLSTGVYLGANVLTTTLSILNNFDANALTKTFKNLPKYRMVELAEAKTPWLQKISRLNNKLYRPIASVDRYIENIATEYIKNIGLDKAKYMQSTIPSKAVVTSPVLRLMKDIVPFGSYPAAAIQEIGANVSGRPLKTGIYNQISKVGQEANILAQENLGLKPDRTKTIRTDEEGNQITRQTIVTPIQAANMFLFGQQGDAVQIPVLNFINKLVSGAGDPNIFEVDGKKYKMDKGVIQTTNGEFNMLPALAYVGRNLLGPVKFYNDVIVPLMSDKYLRDESNLLNTMVNDTQYSSMNAASQRKVVDNARERLGKRVLGTYEYDYFNPNKYISKTTKRKIIRKVNQRRNLQESLRQR